MLLRFQFYSATIWEFAIICIFIPVLWNSKDSEFHQVKLWKKFTKTHRLMECHPECDCSRKSEEPRLHLNWWSFIVQEQRTSEHFTLIVLPMRRYNNPCPTGWCLTSEDFTIEFSPLLLSTWSFGKLFHNFTFWNWKSVRNK